MVSKQMISLYLSSLTPEQGRAFAANYGIKFTKEEADIIVPFLQRHSNELEIKNKDYLLSLISKKVSLQTMRKVETLLNKFNV